MAPADVTIERGLPAEHQQAAVRILDQAFGDKLALAIPSIEKRQALITAGLDTENVITAFVGDELAGIAAVKTKGGRYGSGSMPDAAFSWSRLRAHLGTLGALRAAFVLMFVGHDPKPDELYLEEIAVAAVARGRGIGTMLLSEVEDIAHEEGKTRVELEVIDTNPRAQELYARRGYVVVKTDRFGFLRGIIGFGGVYTMDKFLDDAEVDD